MGILIRSLIVAAILAICQLGVAYYGQELPAADIGPTKSRIEAFPLQIGQYKATEATLDETIFVATQADYMRSLAMADPEGHTASLSLGIWTNFHLGIPHEPIYCYPANGWSERERRLIEIDTPGEDPIQAWLVAFERPGEEGGIGGETAKAAVVYWGQIGKHCVLDRNGIRKVKQSFRGTDIREMPPLVKVHLHINAPTLGDAEGQATDLARIVRELTKDL